MRFRALHPDLGAEVDGFDLEHARGPADIAALRAAYDEHQLLLIRADRAISPARQLEISTWFGPCNTEADQKHTFMDNEEAIGRERLQFHSDNSYSDRPLEGISLHALELPENGAQTCFVSGRAAWARLSPERQRTLATLTSRHRLPTSIMPDWPDLAGDQNLRRIHPRTGDEILYVTEHHSERINELSAEESAATLKKLFANLYAPSRIYTHQWRRFDFLIWDNLALQHARPTTAERSAGRRLLQRVTIGGAPFSEILAQARSKQSA